MRLVRIRFVALDAQHGRIKFGRSDARWVIHVLRQRPVASFTGDADVLPGSFLFENFGVTRLTRSMTRERHRLGRDFCKSNSRDNVHTRQSCGAPSENAR